MIRSLFLVFLFLSSIAKAQLVNQNALLTWLNKNAVDLNKDYLPELAKSLSTNKVLGLGEASHGTKEFYLEKNKIIQYLVQSAGYRQLGMEMMDTEISKINTYLQGGEENLKVLMKNLRLYNVEEIYELFTWIKDYNQKNVDDKIKIFGFHKEEFYDPFTRDSLMAAIVYQTQKATNEKMIVWAHNLHIARNKTMPGIDGMGQYLSNYFKNDYFNIAFDTYEGTVTTMAFEGDGSFKFNINTLEKPINNFTELFSKVEKQNFYVNMRRDNPFSGLINKITNIYADWRKPFSLPVKFDDDFDALIFIRKTSASKTF